MSSSTSPFAITELIIDTQHIREYPHATKSANNVLKLVVKRYTPKSDLNPQPGDLTIIGAHGTGFPKELYEPIWEELYTRLKDQGIRIRSIWIADTANQGASGILNGELLGNDPSWLDHARDLLYMSNAESDCWCGPQSWGWATCIRALLSLLHPRLLSSLILMEPVIEKDIHTGKGPAFVKLSLARKDKWPSLEAAEAWFRKQYRNWDPREKHLIEKAKGTDMNWTVLRPTAFFDNLTPDYFGNVFATAWQMTLKGKPLQLTATSDIGFFAARAFQNLEESKGKFFLLAGDELTYDQMAAIFKQKTGKDVPTTLGFLFD
ncbi:hypothetical protein BJX63DRAFT_429341 [Aspergillus granulosus]|uniref:NmrA-like domain-containing protein n=1 Tax=Aspergillus granulosus TaxID=176169 RepID=A0ABR4HS94_9EURO